MDLEAQIVVAVRTELQRQAAETPGRLSIADGDAPRLEVHGQVDLEALAMAVAGAVAGGP